MLTITFLLLCVKHFIADLYLQATYIRPSRKWIYLDSKAHLHALHHAVLTAVVFLWCWGWWWAVVMLVVDYVTHWHIDWGKTNIARHWNWVEHTHPRAYWFLQTTDQIIHFVMYYVMVWGVGQLV